MSFHDRIKEEINTLIGQIEADAVTDDYVLFRVEWILENMGHVLTLSGEDFPEISKNALRNILEQLHAPAVQPGVGRLKIPVPLSGIIRYLSLGLTVPAIAKIFSVSVRTIRRRMEENDVRVADFYNNLTDDELDGVVRDLQRMFPNSGYRMMQGYLKGRGIRVQEHRLKQSMLRTDPQGLLERTLCLHTIKRRVYNVPAPNCLWHIDGNHKLIRWRIVIHGAIDGFSRLVVYLQASANNRADTVYKHFLQATQKYGIPSRVRSDKGGENRDVASFMISTRGMNRSSHIAGRSVHNQRIERLWRDVYLCVTDLFHTLFRSLESEGILSPDNDLHIFALHWVFLPRLQQHLQSFVEGWNNHPLRTERNQSPQQLWHTNINSPASPDPPQVDELYGVDWRGPPGDRDLDMVIPEVQISRVLTQEELSRLPPYNSTDDDYGVASYIQTLGLLTNWFG